MILYYANAFLKSAMYIMYSITAPVCKCLTEKSMNEILELLSADP